MDIVIASQNWNSKVEHKSHTNLAIYHSKIGLQSRRVPIWGPHTLLWLPRQYFGCREPDLCVHIKGFVLTLVQTSSKLKKNFRTISILLLRHVQLKNLWCGAHRLASIYENNSYSKYWANCMFRLRFWSHLVSGNLTCPKFPRNQTNVRHVCSF